MDDKLKVLIVDDTVTYRQILVDVFSSIKDIEVLGTASNGKIALTKIENLSPDLVFLDVAMPVMDGIETLSEIKKRFPNVDAVMVSGIDKENANLTLKALELGAIDFISKPKSNSISESIAEIKISISRILSLAKTRKYSRQIRRASVVEIKTEPLVQKSILVKPITAPVSMPVEPLVTQKRKIPKIDVVAIGVSTGGPNALNEVIPRLEKNIGVPILAVQHMPPTFTASLAERLNKLSNIKVVEGREGDPVDKGVMYLSPGGIHMVIRKSGFNISIGLVDSPPVKSCRPAVDVLFRSIGMIYGGNVLTVILTGMGNDGTDGVAMIRRKGGYSIVQDEKTSVVWGMPGAVAAANDADEILPLNKIADRIMEIVRRGQASC
ncbi:MAG: chemotaxis response regulator protein-glutamate methylesterase [Desulfobacterales bacterium]|nr:chemotaxis response regulator protein-glutamate methylesterase [Desulfobacterales bacterium]